MTPLIRRTSTGAAVAALGLVLVAGPATAAHEGTAYSADLVELNGSGASGTATATVSEDGESVTVTVDASDLDLDFVHAMHIHGIYDGDLSDDPAAGEFARSICPDMSDDADGDGVLTVLEGAPKYGGVQVSLTTEGDTSADSALAVERYPAGTTIDYERTIPLPNALKDELAAVHVVVHGTDTDDSGDESADLASSLDPSLPVDATAPALCGTLTAVSSGAIQTGGGGTADATDGALGATGAAAAGIALMSLLGLGTVAVRRGRA